ncbi:hypothetical protein AArcSl_1126 [Halalkaliarchaeum desulfuricum]|uniref:Uncharacterized protein n=1 Tax=Halalkaliarchaeum desulfuricum TaxID=2055893 RepID=A0A343TI39_9EURY|nr:hypothetical protein [Halalkaliarchaeum desulfuricum]AUX08761.1 hypothetical protein AArcSl_1126 [Halalkaliarchaeum desulfuricum]
MSDDHTDTDGQSNRTRRGLLRGLGTTAGTTLLAAGLANHIVGSTAAVDAEASEFTAADTPTVEDNDGDVEKVYVAPVIEVDWMNFSEGVDEVEVTLEATVDGQTDEIYDVVLEDIDDESSDEVESTDTSSTGQFSDTNSWFQITFTQHDITDVDSDITEDDFSDNSLDAGDSKVTTVDLDLVVDVRGYESENGTVSISDSFDVEVENPDGETEVDGDANTDAE